MLTMKIFYDLMILLDLHIEYLRMLEMGNGLLDVL
jgi:hypothetical protein